MKYLRSFVVVLLGLVLSGTRKESPGGQDKPVQGEDGDDEADSPADISKTGWKAALKRTKQALKDKNLGMMAAGLAYYSTLTFFPAVLGVASLYTAVAGPGQLQHLLDSLSLVVPPIIQNLLETTLRSLTGAKQSALGVATVVSLLAVIWTTSGGIQNLVRALNVAYEVPETRGFVKLRLSSIVLSIVLMVFSVVVLVLLLLQGDALHALGLPTALANLFPILRWPLLIVALALALSFIYRYAPDRVNPRWSWVSWGATAATIIWLIGTVLFFFYAQNFGSYGKTYGSFASIVILMIWFYLTSQIVLVGAQVNKKLEEVTDTDTADRS
jgi:membrane protein